MPTANDAIYDATIRHQIKLLRYSEGQARSVAELLRRADEELVAKLQTELTEATQAQLTRLLADIRRQRQALAEEIGAAIRADAEELAANEAEWEVEAIAASVPVELKMNAVSPATLQAVIEQPINGVPLEGWLGTLAQGDIRRIEQQLQLGITQGETLDQLVRRIRGTKANNYQDGATSMTRRNAQTIARTAANHVSATARQAVWDANSDIIAGVRWTATLDGRTSDTCRGRDGVVYPIDKGPRPPGHPGCRSTVVPILDGDQIVGERPFVRDTRTRAARETDFRADAKAKAGAKWKDMSKGQRDDAVRAERKRWTEENIGRVASTETYDSWMRKQPKEFQDETLGKAKADLFRGGMTMDKFIDEKGKPYTIAQLKAATSQDKLNVVQPGVGMKAKALLQQGLSAQEVLDSIKKEYPDASTSAASIASYKTELKKAGALDQLVGKVPQGGIKQALAVSDVVSNMEANLPAGLKHAIGGQWANVVEDLDGVPGAYGYYEAGKGVQLSGKKLSAVHPMQAQQVIAHELGHLLHKQHDVQLAGGMLNDAKQYLSPEGKKLYGYYLAHDDELTAEIFAQALSPSVLTSQGLSAVEFNSVFKFEIEKAKGLFQDKFPVPHAKAPEPLKGAPTEPFEVAGNHKTVGGLSKALLQQGLDDEAVLAAVKAHFPDAKTTKASLASYKVELKKAGLLPAKGSGPTVTAKAVPDVSPIPPSPAMQAAVAEKAAAGVKLPTPSLYGKPLTPDQEDALDYATSKFEEAMKEWKLKSPMDFKGLADMKDIMGISLGPADVDAVLALAEYKALEKAAIKQAKKATPKAGDLPAPKLAGTQLGNFSSQMLIKLKTLIANGGDTVAAHNLLKSAFGTAYKEAAGMDLIELAKYEVTTGKTAAKSFLSEAQQKAMSGLSASKKLPQPGDPEYPAWIKAKADAQAAVDEAKKHDEMLSKIDMTPRRVAVTPREAIPPPPRFTAQQRLAAIRRYGVNVQRAKLEKANTAQKRAGLPELSAEEITAVYGYTGNLYTRLNTALRAGQFKADVALQAYVEAAQEGLRKMPKFQGLTSRGMTIPADKLDQVLSAYQRGSIVEEHAFVSTSSGEQAAFGGNVFMKIYSKTGVDVSQFSQFPGEREVLYMPGTRFRVRSVEQVNGKHIVTMEEVDG